MSAIAARKARLALQQSAASASSSASEEAKASSPIGRALATPTKRKAKVEGGTRGNRLNKKQTSRLDRRGVGAAAVQGARKKNLEQNGHHVEASGEREEEEEEDVDDDEDSSIGGSASSSSSSGDEGEIDGIPIDERNHKKQTYSPLEINKCTFSITKEGPFKNWHVEKSDDRSETTTLFLALTSGQVLTFLGKVVIQILAGQCELAGARLTSKHKAVAVFAPQYSPLPLLRADAEAKPVQGYASTYGFADDRYTVIVRIRSILGSGIDDIAKACPLLRPGLFAPRTTAAAAHLLTGDFECFHPIFNSIDGQKSAQIPASWQEGLQMVEKTGSHTNSVYLIRGPKRVGKSTFSRQLLHRLLSTRSTDVAYLETDLGQTEFGPPGMAALYLFGTLVDNEGSRGNSSSSPSASPSDLVIGPSWTSLRRPVRAHFVGDATPRNDPKRYLAAIADLISHYKETLQSSGVPIIVNTQGWIKGLGADLLQELEEMLCPSHTFELAAVEEQDTTATLAAMNPSADSVPHQRQREETSKAKIIIKLDPIPSTLTRDRGLNAVESRTVNLVSYFYSTRLPGSATSTSSSVQHRRPQWDFSQALLQQRPYLIDIQEGLCGGIHILPIGASVDTSLQLMALNGSCVAIVRTDDHDDGRQGYSTRQEQNNTAGQYRWHEALSRGLPTSAKSTCLALAIVRSIDLEKGQVYLLSPLSMQDIQQSHPPSVQQDHHRICLVKGAIEVPIWLSLSFPLIAACHSSHQHQHHPTTNSNLQQLEGVPLGMVPYLEFPSYQDNAERNSSDQVIGLERRKIRRNILRRSQKTSMQAPP